MPFIVNKKEVEKLNVMFMKALHCFTTGKTYIRRFSVSDEAKFIELLCNPRVSDNLAFDDRTKTVDGAKSLLELTISSYDTENPLLAFAIEHKTNGEFIGATGLNPLNQHEVEIFYALLPNHWGKGIATEVLKGCSNYIFCNTSFQVILAFITQNNDASKRVAEKNGFINKGLIKNQNFRELVFLFKIEKITSGREK